MSAKIEPRVSKLRTVSGFVSLKDTKDDSGMVTIYPDESTLRESLQSNVDWWLSVRGKIVKKYIVAVTASGEIFESTMGATTVYVTRRENLK